LARDELAVVEGENVSFPDAVEASGDSMDGRAEDERRNINAEEERKRMYNQRSNVVWASKRTIPRSRPLRISG